MEKQTNPTIQQGPCEDCGGNGVLLEINGVDRFLCPKCMRNYENIKSLGYTAKLADGLGRYTIKLAFELPALAFGGADYTEITYTYDDTAATREYWVNRAKLELLSPLFGCKNYEEVAELILDEDRKEEAVRILGLFHEIKEVRPRKKEVIK